MSTPPIRTGVAVGNEAAQGAADPGRFIACQYVGGSERDGTIRQSVRAIYAPKGTDTPGRARDEHADRDGVLACWLGEGGWRLEWLCGPPVARESANADFFLGLGFSPPRAGEEDGDWSGSSVLVAWESARVDSILGLGVLSPHHKTEP